VSSTTKLPQTVSPTATTSTDGASCPLEQAARQSGLHINTLRLLREGVIHGYKASYQGKQHWLVSTISLKHYTDPVIGFLLDLPGPKIFLKKSDQ
jgi:hypothetical protein